MSTHLTIEDEAILREFFGVPGVEVVKTMITIAGSTERAVRNQMSEMQEAVATLFVEGDFPPVITFPEPEQDQYDVWVTTGAFTTGAGSVEAVKAWQAFIHQTPADTANEGGAV